MGEIVAGSSKLGVNVNLQLNGEDAGMTEFRCGTTSVKIDRYGTASGLRAPGLVGNQGYDELVALFEAVAHIYRDKGKDGSQFR